MSFGVTDLALLTGYNLLGTGISAAIAVPSGRIWGKRHLYVLGGAIYIIASLWGGGSGANYNSLAAARFFQGIALGPYESLLNASVGDLYHVHERGLRYAFVNTLLFGGTFLTPVVVGVLTKAAGWPWTFWLIAIVSGVLYPAVVLLCPETAFRRDTLQQPTDLATSSSNSVTSEPKDGARDKTREVSPIVQRKAVGTQLVTRRSLRIFTGRQTDEHFFRLFLRPFPLFFNPGIAFACITLGGMIGWTTMIGLTLSITFAGAPLNFTEVQTGYLYTGAFVGGMLGLLFSGLGDMLPRWLSHRNNGVFEPEFRLVLVAGQLFFGVMGLIGYGYTASNLYEFHAVIPDMFFGFMVIGMVLGTVAAASYIVDGYKDVAIEGLTCTVLFKNFFAFALTVKGFEWLLSQGVFWMFVTVGCVQTGLCCLAIPMWIFGKRNRAFWARNSMMKTLRLE